MWNWRAGSAFRRRPVCGGCGRWRRRAIIKGYRGLLDEKRLGYELVAFAMVHLSSQAEADLNAFEAYVRKQPLVRECWMLSGEIDFILKCVAPDLKAFQAFVAELTGAPHVRNVKTSLTLRNSKDEAIVPLRQNRQLKITRPPALELRPASSRGSIASACRCWPATSAPSASRSRHSGAGSAR